ncbi:TetR/AcrR family transcriptional regulator [Isosphaeraceae bacterium EP7]
MRYAAGHKEQTRAKILRAAGRVFRRLGYHAAGVDTVMEEAGLTAGGFYSHFPSKDALLAEALAPAAADVGARLSEGLDGLSARDRVLALIDRYLSPEHRVGAEDGCPLPALVSEVARGNASVKRSFESILGAGAARFRVEPGEGGPDEGRALAIFALCVGGLGVARSVEDEALAGKILDACRDLARQALDPPAPAEAGTREGA